MFDQGIQMASEAPSDFVKVPSHLAADSGQASIWIGIPVPYTSPYPGVLDEIWPKPYFSLLRE